MSIDSAMNEDGVIADIISKFNRAESERYVQEEIWSKAYHNYRGKYYKDIHFTDTEKSRAFIKATKTKVLAAHGQAIDLLFQGGNLPIFVSETDIPQENTNTSMDMLGVQQPQQPIPQSPQIPNLGYKGDGVQVPPGAKAEDMYKMIQGQQATAQPMMQQAMPAMKKDYAMAARNMNRLIHDQIKEGKGHVSLVDSMFEAALLGTGVIKGPFTFEKATSQWKNGTLTQSTTSLPKIEFVSCWNFYPDPNATCMDECDWIIQRHKLNRTQLANLREQPEFISEEINELLDSNGNYTQRDFELEVQAEQGTVSEPQKDRWEVLEYWGVVSSNTLYKDGSNEDLHINAWVCDGHLLRLIMNPFEPTHIPYLAFPYEKNPYSFWGVGVAENMDDMQSLMNSTARMSIDNLNLAGNLVFDIDESALAPGDDGRIYAGKKFIRQSGAPGQAVYGIKFPNTAHENMMLFDRWRQLADESTGIPSFSHGNTGVTGMTRTAAGMSMLFGAANLHTKTYIKNIDDFLFEPLGQYFFYWNKQFYEGDLDIEGDLEVKAMGSQSLIQKEVKSQRLLTLLQLASNPQVAPMINIQELVKDIAVSLDSDADKYINDMDAARRQAEIVGLQNMQQQRPQDQGMQGGVTGNGNANIGVGNAPQPGESQFSANTGEGQ